MDGETNTAELVVADCQGHEIMFYWSTAHSHHVNMVQTCKATLKKVAFFKSILLVSPQNDHNMIRKHNFLLIKQSVAMSSLFQL